MMHCKLATIVASFVLSGCWAHIAYDNAETGEFTGVLEIRWLEPDRFLFVPNQTNPLRFKTAAGDRVIEPKPMYTDGGSIPRIFWSIPGYSPWGLAPAYIIHDWLFVAHHCNTAGYEDVSFPDSSRFMGESIKTLMETNRVPRDETLFFNVVAAVRTPIAKRLWDEGECDLPADEVAYGFAVDVKPVLERELEMVRKELDGVENELRTATDAARKQQLELYASKLRSEIIEINRLSTAAAAQPQGAPATRLLYTIDMSRIR